MNKKIAGLLSKMGENDKIALDMRNSWTEVQLQLDSVYFIILFYIKMKFEIFFKAGQYSLFRT